MVFSGRPSSACHACRVTRLKCDRIQTGCTQCARKNLQCPGYRNTCELRLRNETDRVVEKAQKSQLAKTKPYRNKKARSPKSPSQSPPSDDLAVVNTPSRSPSPYGLLGNVTEDAAKCYFLSSYIKCSPFLRYLPELYKGEYLGEDGLSSAISAVSLATFALRVGEHSFMDKGQNMYALALSRTNAALADPMRATSDRTLAAVLLMGHFESTIFAGRASPTEWTAHIFGALKLLRLRGLQQFNTNVGAQLFSHAASNMRVSCIQRQVPVPDEFIALFDKAVPFLDPKDPTNRLGPILDKAADIRARGLVFLKSSKNAQYDLIQDAVDLDRAAAALIDKSEFDFAFTTRSAEDTPSWAYLNIASQYSSHRAVKFWNGIRMVQLFLNEVIWLAASSVINDLVDQEKNAVSDEDIATVSYFESLKLDAVEETVEVVTNILASVPDFVEPGSENQKFSPAARTLLWPLNLVHRCAICASGPREMARTYLKEIWKDLNLRQLPDEALQDDDVGNTEDWLHLYHLD